MSSIPYPQMVQGLQMPATNEMGPMQETSALANSAAPPILADLSAGPHFYQEFVRQTPLVDGFALTHTNKLRSDNNLARSIPNESKHVEIM